MDNAYLTAAADGVCRDDAGRGTASASAAICTRRHVKRSDGCMIGGWRMGGLWPGSTVNGVSHQTRFDSERVYSAGAPKSLHDAKVNLSTFVTKKSFPVLDGFRRKSLQKST
jgi:hypothetical protein